MIAFRSVGLHAEGMPSDRLSVEALKNLISQVDLLISTTEPLPENPAEPLHENVDPTFYALNERLFKEVGEHWAALCLWFGYYNFCRIHKSLRVTPAMEAGSRITFGI